MPANWKMSLLGLLVALPMAAFVVGSLVASAADSPPARSTLVIQDATPAPVTPVAPTTTNAAQPAPTAPTSTSPTSAAPTSAAPTSAAPRPTQDSTAASSDDGVRDITPGYDDLPGSDDKGDDHGDDHGGGRDDDHSGHGSSGSSGSGGGRGGHDD